MISKLKGRLFWTTLLFTLFSSVYADSTEDSPCGGADALLSIVDRPSVGDSACLAPYKTALLETGAQYQKLLDGGSQQNYPQALLRVGLANKFEINFQLPNYNHQSFKPTTGFSASNIGLKYELKSTPKGVATIEGIATLPSGSAEFGNRHAGAAVYGLFNYSLTDKIGLSGMLGVSSQSESILDGGNRYASVNPDLVISWSESKSSYYLELFGQSKTGSDAGSGFIMDAGILYLLTKNIVLDLEVGKRISGEIFDINHYVGAGISIQFA